MKKFTANIVVLLALASVGYPQNCSINWHKIAGGGGMSGGGVYTLNGTVGQLDVGVMSSGNYSLTGGFWATAPAVQRPGSPFLFITRSGSNAVISWAATATSFVLKRNSTLLTNVGWIPVSPVPSLANGFNYVTNAISPGNTFYRLRYP